MLNILFTGKSDFEYNRVKILLEGLKQLDGIKLEIYPISSRKSFDKQLFQQHQVDANFVYIPPFRHRDVSFIKKYTNKPIVFDPLISKYLTKIDDYNQAWKGPLKYYLDKRPFKKCDILLADTKAHKNYFHTTFSIDQQKIEVLPIGIDSKLFFPTKKPTSHLFKVGFYGSFVPLQGVSKIIEAANILKDQTNIKFEIIGSGYDLAKVNQLINKYQLSNVNMHGWLEYDKLNEAINSFDICLGIFGDSKKASLVIPNKVYHYAGLNKAVITRDSPAIREIFTHQKNIHLIENTPQALADSIMQLQESQVYTQEIAENAGSLIRKNYNAKNIAQQFVDILLSFSNSPKK